MHYWKICLSKKRDILNKIHTSIYVTFKTNLQQANKLLPSMNEIVKFCTFNQRTKIKNNKDNNSVCAHKLYLLICKACVWTLRESAVKDCWLKVTPNFVAGNYVWNSFLLSIKNFHKLKNLHGIFLIYYNN